MVKSGILCPFYRIFRARYMSVVWFCDNLISGVPQCVVNDFYPDWGAEDTEKVAEWLAGTLVEPEICSHFVRTDARYTVYPATSNCFFGDLCVQPSITDFSFCSAKCPRFTMLAFDDVVKCNSVGEFNLFVRQYLAERGLIADGKHEETSKTYWALFYAWKNSLAWVG